MCTCMCIESKRREFKLRIQEIDMLRRERHDFDKQQMTTDFYFIVDSTQCWNKVNGSGSDDWHLLAHQLDRTNLTKAYTSRRQRSPSFCALMDTGPARHWNDPPRGWRDCSRFPLGPTPLSSRSSIDRFRQSKIRPITRSRLHRSPLRYQLFLLVWNTFSSR